MYTLWFYTINRLVPFSMSSKRQKAKKNNSKWNGHRHSIIEIFWIELNCILLQIHFECSWMPKQFRDTRLSLNFIEYLKLHKHEWRLIIISYGTTGKRSMCVYKRSQMLRQCRGATVNTISNLQWYKCHGIKSILILEQQLRWKRIP